jgi:ubiquinone/menaquinone biosynthesis C-methylase UbiE
MNFEYSKEWYEQVIDSSWLQMGGDRTTPEGLKKWYNSKQNESYRNRLLEWFKEQELFGKCLELGVNCGKTIYWLHEMYPSIRFDVLDWNKNLQILKPAMSQLVPIDDFIIGDCSSIDKHNESYNNITSIDFYEHIPEEVYFKSIEEVNRLLKRGGKFFVFLGHTIQPEHINIRNIDVIKSDISNKGFDFVTKRIFENDVLQIFIKR